MSDNEKLLPCPFCGGRASVRLFYGGRYGVYCDCCSSRVGGLFQTKGEAIAAWNNRFWGNEIMLMGDRLYFEGLGTFERVKDEH